MAFSSVRRRAAAVDGISAAYRVVLYASAGTVRWQLEQVASLRNRTSDATRRLVIAPSRRNRAPYPSTPRAPTNHPPPSPATSASPTGDAVTARVIGSPRRASAGRPARAARET